MAVSTTIRRADGKLFIDGSFEDAAAGSAPIHDKATGEEIGRHAVGEKADVDRAVAAAVRAQPGWAALPGEARGEVLRRASLLLDERAEEIVETIMRETGAVRAKAEGEVGAARRKFNESAGLAARRTGDVLPEAKPGKLTMLQRIPLGVIAAITPWNFPLVLAMRPLAPGIALGNTVVLKPSNLAPIAGGQILVEILDEAGLPPGVVNLVTGTGVGAGEPLARHPDVAMIHFTGSTEVGLRMGEIAARDRKRASLELGGDNAFVVLDDADVQAAAACGAWSAYEYQGQTCITSSRHIVMRAVADEYLESLTARARGIRIGDPASPETDLGPMISEAQRERVDGLVQESVRMGARVVVGGPADGLFYQPTVLDDVTPEMPVFTQEIFGPVAPVTVVDTEEEALELVNRHHALVNSVYTGDLMRGLAFAERVRSGMVHVNDAGGRPTGELDLDEFTQRRWIGIQRTPLRFPY